MRGASPLTIGDIIAGAQGDNQLSLSFERTRLRAAALDLDRGDLGDMGEHAMITGPRRPVAPHASA